MRKPSVREIVLETTPPSQVGNNKIFNWNSAGRDNTLLRQEVLGYIIAKLWLAKEK